MSQLLLSIHSITRWLLLIALVYAIYRAYKGYRNNLSFSKTDNSIRHWTATLAHIQLVIGIWLYTQSQVTSFFWKNFKTAVHHPESLFFGLLHITLMLTAIVFLTIGSAKAKRKTTDREKFKTMLLWFAVALFLIFIAVPWPFSPLAGRPYLR